MTASEIDATVSLSDPYEMERAIERMRLESKRLEAERRTMLANKQGRLTGLVGAQLNRLSAALKVLEYAIDAEIRGDCTF